MLVKVKARLFSAPETVIPRGAEVLLKDEDPLLNDPLASGIVSANGLLELLFNLSDARSGDTPLEAYPDLVFQWIDPSGQLHRSATHANVDYWTPHPVTGMRHDGVIDLGDIELQPVQPKA